MNEALISVIINTCNRSVFIGRAVDSVLQQDYPNFELLIMDASNNEETSEIMKAYNDVRIKYHRILNEEYFAKTFFYAISLCQGRYVAFNDDDDEWISPQKLSKQVTLIESLPDDYGVVYCWWEMWYDDLDSAAVFPHKENRGNLLEQMLYDNAIHGTPSLLIKKELFKEVEGLLNRPDILPSDHFMMTYFSRKHRIDFVPEVLVRCHERHTYGSMGRKPTNKFGLKHRINLQLLFLKTFAEDYKRLPDARKKRYENIISYSIGVLNPGYCFYYSTKHLLEFGDFNFFIKNFFKLIYALYASIRLRVTS